MSCNTDGSRIETEDCSSGLFVPSFTPLICNEFSNPLRVSFSLISQESTGAPQTFGQLKDRVNCVRVIDVIRSNERCIDGSGWLRVEKVI